MEKMEKPMSNSPFSPFMPLAPLPSSHHLGTITLSPPWNYHPLATLELPPSHHLGTTTISPPWNYHPLTTLELPPSYHIGTTTLSPPSNYHPLATLELTPSHHLGTTTLLSPWNYHPGVVSSGRRLPALSTLVDCAHSVVPPADSVPSIIYSPPLVPHWFTYLPLSLYLVGVCVVLFHVAESQVRRLDVHLLSDVFLGRHFIFRVAAAAPLF